MGKKIYVGNLPFSTTSDSLCEIFAQFGEVDSSKIIMDRETGRSKGFGFVEMSSGEAADSAIEKLHGSDFGGRALTVNEARPTERRDPARAGMQAHRQNMNRTGMPFDHHNR
jgi:cold-inducible RNA-binding protein